MEAESVVNPENILKMAGYPKDLFREDVDLMVSDERLSFSRSRIAYKLHEHLRRVKESWSIPRYDFYRKIDADLLWKYDGDLQRRIQDELDGLEIEGKIVLFRKAGSMDVYVTSGSRLLRDESGKI